MERMAFAACVIAWSLGGAIVSTHSVIAALVVFAVGWPLLIRWLGRL